MFMAPDNKIDEVIQKLLWNEVGTSVFTPMPRFLKTSIINVQRYKKNFIISLSPVTKDLLHSFCKPKSIQGVGDTKIVSNS